MAIHLDTIAESLVDICEGYGPPLKIPTKAIFASEQSSWLLSRKSSVQKLLLAHFETL